jgi:carbamoyltransferase
VLALGLSGLPFSQQAYLRDNPGIDPADSRICQGMDSAACLVGDGRIIAAAAEERFTGEKATGAFPANAIGYCLSEAGVRPRDVGIIAHGFNYDRFRRFFLHNLKQFDEALSSQTVIGELSRNGWDHVAERFRPVDHHLAHAASAYYASDFGEALSVVSDGMGEIVSLTVHHVRDGDFRQLHSQGIATSLGILYSLLTRFLGYTFNSDEYKVMGLSAYGDPSRYASFFAELLAEQDGRIKVGLPRAALRHPAQGYPDAMTYLGRSLGVARRNPAEEVRDVHADIAASFQARVTAVLTALVGHWLGQTGADSVCLSGGTFLNCVANGAIAQLPQVKRLFIPPAAGDDGTAIGSALYAASTRLTAPYTPYSGPRYDSADVAKALKTVTAETAGLEWSLVSDLEQCLDLAARDIANDLIIAWFAGRMEFGPRALGNRSILALPGGRDIKDRLNHAVKLRESFRPFAPAILDSDYDEFFTGRALSPGRYMLVTVQARPERAAEIAGAVHVDGTARVQVVRRDENELFWRLLRKVKERTGIGCVINTSFNVKNQPIIRDPETAVRSFGTMALDRLYIEGYRVSPTAARAPKERTARLPVSTITEGHGRPSAPES